MCDVTFVSSNLKYKVPNEAYIIYKICRCRMRSQRKTKAFIQNISKCKAAE